MVVIELPDEAATAALATRLARLARRGDVIALKGELGTGKTSFARAFVRARGSHDEVVPRHDALLADHFRSSAERARIK